MKLYNFTQNNSGGDFIVDDNVTYDVLIEADTVDEANAKAEEVGIYFNGCEEGYDCSCCGDRWNEAWDDDVDDYSVFEFESKENAIEHFSAKTKGMFRQECIIYFKDGTKSKITYK